MRYRNIYGWVGSMIKGKKAGKTLDEIGKRWHDFDIKSEKIIYCYLCCNRYRLINKKLRNLNDDLKFEEYRQWKYYICNKYQNYSKEKLIEFSRYLNLKIRNIKPSHEYWIIMATAFLSMLLTKAVEIVTGIQKDFSNYSVWITLSVTLVVEALVIMLLIYLIVKIVYPIYDNHFDENFLIDYKEIIDDIIKER